MAKRKIAETWDLLRKVTVKLVELTLQADDLRIFGDSVGTGDHATGIGIRGIRLIVVAPKNIVECIIAEAGQPDLPAVLHVVLLVDVVSGHAVWERLPGSRAIFGTSFGIDTRCRYESDVSSSGGLHSTASSCSPGDPEAGERVD